MSAGQLGTHEDKNCLVWLLGARIPVNVRRPTESVIITEFKNCGVAHQSIRMSFGYCSYHPFVSQSGLHIQGWKGQGDGKGRHQQKNGFWVCGFTLLMFFSGEMFFRVSRHVMTCLPSASGKLT